jgi:putative Mg2+ transporter-C (MgtC) family protein
MNPIAYEIIGEVAVAMLLGGLIGLERELAHRPAGLRTHMLVAAMAALLVGLGNVMLRRFSSAVDNDFLNTDPIRIVEAIITGVSFLCAGTIFRLESQHRVEGLTTAATLLLAAALGICVALQEILLASIVTVMVLAVVWVVGQIEKRLNPDPPKVLDDKKPGGHEPS